MCPSPLPFLAVNCNSDADMKGLFDVAFDPGWTSNNFFYISYTIDSGNVDEDGVCC